MGAKNKPAVWALSFALTLTLGAAAGKAAGGSDNVKTQPAGDTRAPVLVELFTSEGCSDCPPADRLLIWLEDTQPIRGVRVIPLSEHVDYWNHQGWTDPFSSSAFSERQADYSHSLHSDEYTPQMVVDGKVAFVGSQKIQALAAISNEMRAERAAVSIEPVDDGAAGDKNAATFSIEIGNLPSVGKKAQGLVFLAVTEDNLKSDVLGGENSGHQLVNSAVVRKIKLIGKLDARPDANFHAQPSVEISSAWKRTNLRAVVFVQLRDSHRILGAAETRFPSS